MKLKNIIYEIKMFNWEAFWPTAGVIVAIVVCGMLYHNINEAYEQSIAENVQTITVVTKEAKITNLDIETTEYKTQRHTYYYVTVGEPVNHTFSVSKEEFSKFTDGATIIVDITTTTNTSRWLRDTIVEYDIKGVKVNYTVETV